MQQAGYHQANLIADKVLSEVESVQDNVLQLLKKYDDYASQSPLENATVAQSEITMPTAIASSTSSHSTTTPSMANISQIPSNNFQMEQMMSMMRTLQEEMKTIKSSNSTKTRGPYTRKTDKYCWSHGACAHESKDCFSKKQGHQDQATFNNKMGGSTTRCQNQQNNE